MFLTILCRHFDSHGHQNSHQTADHDKNEEVRVAYAFLNISGNHTWKHPYLTEISKHNARNQILLTQERIDELLGYHYPLRLLRPPFGEFTQELLNLFAEYGVEKTVLWDVSYTDPQEAFKHTENGSILLFHTNYVDYNCLVELIPMLQEAGYELVTVSDLIGMEPLQTSEEKYVFPYR